jgi:hypothetical protein
LKSEPGKDFLKNVDKSKAFSNEKRLKLIKLINAHCAYHKIALKVAQMKDIVDQITEEFPEENAESYFHQVNGKASGSLYNNHNNMLKRLRADNLIESRKRPRNQMEESSQQQPDDSPEFSQVEKSSNECVQSSSANMSVDILRDHWQKSSRIRVHTFQSEKNKSILSMYRALQRPDASMLVSSTIN